MHLNVLPQLSHCPVRPYKPRHQLLGSQATATRGRNYPTCIARVALIAVLFDGTAAAPTTYRPMCYNPREDPAWGPPVGR